MAKKEEQTFLSVQMEAVLTVIREITAGEFKEQAISILPDAMELLNEAAEIEKFNYYEDGYEEGFDDCMKCYDEELNDDECEQCEEG